MNIASIASKKVVGVAQEHAPAIEVSNLVKCYPEMETNAVDGISFTVRRGEIIGLLGPNGAGKTTTIGILTTRVRPTSGTATICGIDVAADPMRVKQLIAVMPQQSNLDRSLRAREILTLHASYHGVPHREREARADTLLNELGLSNRGKDKVSYYSGGMAQRLMLARSLMHVPQVLFLDEPTNSLDPQSRLFLWDRIRSLNAQGMTILLTTHDMHEADRLCERIAIMDDGRILVLDTATALKKLVPGSTCLELRVCASEIASPGRASSDEPSHLCVLDALRAVPGAVKVEEIPVPLDAEDEQGLWIFRLYAQDAGALIVGATQAIREARAELQDLHIAQPGLEDVFIYLTGRNLRS